MPTWKYYYIMSELKDQLKYGLDSKNLMNTLTLLSILNRNTTLWTTVTAFSLFEMGVLSCFNK